MEKIKDIRSLNTRNNGHRTTTMAIGKTTITNHTMALKSSGEIAIIIIKIIEVHIREITNIRTNLKMDISRITNMPTMQTT